MFHFIFRHETSLKAVSFHFHNVIAKGNEAVKTAVEVLIWLPFPQSDPRISLRPEAGVLRLFPLFVGDQRSFQQQAALTACFGICWAHLLAHGKGKRVRAFKLAVFLHTLSEGLLSGDRRPVCVVKTRAVLRGDPKLDPLSNSSSYFTPAFPSGWLFWVCCSVFPALQLGSRLTLFPEDSDCNPDALREADRRRSTIHPQDPG